MNSLVIEFHLKKVMQKLVAFHSSKISVQYCRKKYVENNFRVSNTKKKERTKNGKVLVMKGIY